MSERTPSGLTTSQPPWEATTGVLQVVDLEAAEHDWEVFPGMVVHGYAFNGQTPGPVVEAEAGDTLLVQFTNLMQEPTTIRWYGLPEPTVMNGSGPAADPVPPGGRLRYHLHLPHAGTFWYSSPIAATTQVDRGLSGVLVVRGPEEPAFDGERVLLFSDLELNRHGELGGPDPLVVDDRFGDEGVALLVNGVLRPQMQIPAGHVERWRLVNTSACHLPLSFGGHLFRLIATDDPVPHALDEVLMAPRDRLDLAVGPFTPGEAVVLEAVPEDRRVSRSVHRALATLYVAPLTRQFTPPGMGVHVPPRAH